MGAEDGWIFAYDTATGKELGEYHTGGAVYAAPALAADVAYCPSNDGTLYAIDRSSFALLWKVTIGDALDAGVATADAVYVGSNNGRL